MFPSWIPAWAHHFPFFFLHTTIHGPNAVRIPRQSISPSKSIPMPQTRPRPNRGVRSSGPTLWTLAWQAEWLPASAASLMPSFSFSFSFYSHLSCINRIPCLPNHHNPFFSIHTTVSHPTPSSSQHNSSLTHHT